MRMNRALAPVVGLLALVATACPPDPGPGTTTTTTSTTSTTTTTTLADADNDGYNTGSDCNDNDASINPGQTVDTLGDGIDSNCDGQDGVATNTVFVSTAGTDVSTCGDIATPCRQINQGEIRAISLGRTQVQDSEGSFDSFVLLAGLEVGGHYKSSTWQKAGAGNTVVNAAFDAGVDGTVAMQAVGITAATKVADLRLVGTTAPAGKTSYAAIVRNSSAALVLDTVTVVGGTGGTGSNGSAGTPACRRRFWRSATASMG